MTGESIPGVECMGKVVALGSTISSYGKWPTPTLTLGKKTPLQVLRLGYCIQGVRPLNGVRPFSHAN